MATICVNLPATVGNVVCCDEDVGVSSVFVVGDSFVVSMVMVRVVDVVGDWYVVSTAVVVVTGVGTGGCDIFRYMIPSA